MDIDDIRRQNLRNWIDTDPVSNGNVESWCAYYSQFVEPDEKPFSPTHLRQLVPKKGKATRNIGEDLARKLERAKGAKTGALDLPPEAGGHAAKENAPRKMTIVDPVILRPQHRQAEEAIFHILDAAAACGDGYVNGDYPELIHTIVMTTEESMGLVGTTNRSGSIQVLLANGDSMTPTIQPRDLLFVDTSVREYKKEGIYLLRHSGELLCKRLSMSGKTLIVTSDNQMTPPWKWKDRDDTDAIIGRVLCALPMTFKRF